MAKFSCGNILEKKIENGCSEFYVVTNITERRYELIPLTFTKDPYDNSPLNQIKFDYPSKITPMIPIVEGENPYIGKTHKKIAHLFNLNKEDCELTSFEFIEKHKANLEKYLRISL